jgi:hypothetical protein
MSLIRDGKPADRQSHASLLSQGAQGRIGLRAKVHNPLGWEGAGWTTYVAGHSGLRQGFHVVSVYGS